MDFASVQDGDPPLVGVHPGYHEETAFLRDHGDTLAATPTLGQPDAADYPAISYVGGHGAMWDFPGSEDPAAFAAEVYAASGLIGAIYTGRPGSSASSSTTTPT